MRARYSAFALDDVNYLKASWHAETRPATLSLDPAQRWLGLAIIDSGVDGDRGWVHFRATSRKGHHFAALEERARFRIQDGCWRYFDGDAQLIPLTPGRNSSCPCGSGRKYKRCCTA